MKIVKLVKHTVDSQVGAKVYKDSETGEFVTKLFTANGHYPAADYFTNDLQDAIDTGCALVKKAAHSPGETRVGTRVQFEDDN
jgi:hypothetical protein